MAQNPSAVPALSRQSMGLPVSAPPGAPANRGRLQLLRALIGSTPGLLRLALGGIWLCALLLLLAGWLGIDWHRQTMRMIGRDSAPSIIAAQHIRTSLARMHAQFANQLLGGSEMFDKAGGEYERSREEATNALIAAAENITYNDAERIPIRKLLISLGAYEQAVAQSRALMASPDGASLAKMREADRVLHDELLPTADMLDRANLNALDGGFIHQRTAAGLATVLTIIAAIFLLASLVATQIFLSRRTHRTFNPALLIASVLAGWLGVSLVGSFWTESIESEMVRQDCFESIHILWRARACAQDAEGTLLLSVVERGKSPQFDGRFAQNYRRLFLVSAGLSPEVVVSIISEGPPPEGFTGYLADELRNITFPGERDAAAEAVRQCLNYYRASVQLQDQMHQGQMSEAITSAFTEHAAAFSRFDTALSRTIEINQREFDAAVPRGLAALNGLLSESFVLLGLVSILAYAGLRPRLKEYA